MTLLPSTKGSERVMGSPTPKRLRTIGLALSAVLFLAGCSDDKKAAAPPPAHELTGDAIGTFCGMNVLEHEGPKGQILLESNPSPIWFTSARDAIAFTMLPEEPKDILAIYVSDMGKAENWKNPGTKNWTDARQAFFVIGSDMRGGMGMDEAIPFSTKETAESFVAQHSGHIVGFKDIPKDYILGSGGKIPSSANKPNSHGTSASH